MSEDPHQALLDEARHAQAVADRSQRRLLEEADEQDATFLGSLEVAAEAGGTLVLETSVGRRVRGTVRAVAAEHLTVATDGGLAWLPLRAVTLVRGVGRAGVRAAGGERPPRPAVPLATALRIVVEHGTDIEVCLDGGSTVRGTPVAVGRDVLTVRDPATGADALVHLDRVALVTTQAA